jgi:prolyl-tRNA editing enzyme YbaK/EbsC (Cys-tRNA(Pro) deacylase)
MYAPQRRTGLEAALAEAGVAVEVVEFAESTRTAAEAAAAIGTTVAQIVKSLVFLAGRSRCWCLPPARTVSP